MTHKQQKNAGRTGRLLLRVIRVVSVVRQPLPVYPQITDMWSNIEVRR